MPNVPTLTLMFVLVDGLCASVVQIILVSVMLLMGQFVPAMLTSTALLSLLTNTLQVICAYWSFIIPYRRCVL